LLCTREVRKEAREEPVAVVERLYAVAVLERSLAEHLERPTDFVIPGFEARRFTAQPHAPYRRVTQQVSADEDQRHAEQDEKQHGDERQGFRHLSIPVPQRSFAPAARMHLGDAAIRPVRLVDLLLP